MNRAKEWLDDWFIWLFLAMLILLRLFIPMLLEAL